MMSFFPVELEPMHGAPASPIIGSPIFPGFNPLLDLLNELEGHDSHKVKLVPCGFHQQRQQRQQHQQRVQQLAQQQRAHQHRQQLECQQRLEEIAQLQRAQQQRAQRQRLEEIQREMRRLHTKHYEHGPVAQHRVPQQQPSTASASQVETEAYGPMFDLRETEMFYEVHGRLPYRNRDHVQIECTDEHTMVVRVREIEPIFGESSQPESATPTAPTTTTPEAEAEAEAEDKSETSGIKSNKSYQATVEDALEDDEEEDGFSVISSPKATPPESSKSEAAEPVAPTTEEVQKKAPTPAPASAQTQTQNESRWKVVGERNIGESTHTFKFKERVLHHGVVAHMTNGVLKITVPKAKHHPRRIQIN